MASKGPSSNLTHTAHAFLPPVSLFAAPGRADRAAAVSRSTPTSARPLWQEGMALAPHHFQAQRRWLEDETARALDALLPFAWGVSAVEVDADALRGGRLALIAARGRFPDGTPLQAPDPDPLPASSSLADRFSPLRDSHLVHLALSPWRHEQANVAAHDAAGAATRFRSEERVLPDETTGSDALTIAVAVKNLRLVLDEELAADDVSLPIARVRRDAAGFFALDPQYVPPCLHYGASPRLEEMLHRILGMIEAKSAALLASSSQAYAGNDVATRWLLHALRSAEAPLRHLHTARTAHPERLWLELARLAGALCTFSLVTQARDLPAYRHDDLEGCFGALEQHLQRQLNTVVSVRTVRMPLTEREPTLHVAPITDGRCFQPQARWYLAARTALGPQQTATRLPVQAKVCASRFVLELVRRAMEGLVLEPVPTPPPAIAPRPDMTYFTIVLAGKCATALEKLREIGVYVPESLPGAALELIVLLPE